MTFTQIRLGTLTPRERLLLVVLGVLLFVSALGAIHQSGARARASAEKRLEQLTRDRAEARRLTEIILKERSEAAGSPRPERLQTAADEAGVQLIADAAGQAGTYTFSASSTADALLFVSIAGRRAADPGAKFSIFPGADGQVSGTLVTSAGDGP
jgi:hypothetical protein